MNHLSDYMNATGAGKRGAPDQLPDALSNDRADENGNHVEKIRDILFGHQMRDYDKRFARLEERLLKEVSEIRDEQRKRFLSLEGELRAEVESLTASLKELRGEQNGSARELAKELKENAKNWERRATLLEESQVKSIKELRFALQEELKRVENATEGQHQELAVRLDHESSELRDSLADRQALAELFGEIGLRLKNNFGPAEKK